MIDAGGGGNNPELNYDGDGHLHDRMVDPLKCVPGDHLLCSPPGWWCAQGFEILSAACV